MSPEPQHVFRSIVAGTDGSETASEAVREAAELASVAGATLHLVRAYGPVSGERFRDDRRQAPEDVRWLINSKQEAERILAAEAEGLRGNGLRVEAVAVEGDPAGAILEVAENVEADLIVVGNKGMTGTARFLLGSVPDKISHHAPCSVWIVRTT